MARGTRRSDAPAALAPRPPSACRTARPRARPLTFVSVVALSVLPPFLAACAGSGSAGSSSGGSGSSASKPGYGNAAYLVYWDQNEEADFLSMPSGKTGRLVPPWDINGQICLLPDGSGRFVGGYNPTVPGQHNPGGLKPYKAPPIGESLDEANGSFSGQTLSIPGPYTMPGQTAGGDVPPTAKGVFNDDASMTGCVFDRAGDLLAADVGTAQGAFPVPDDGRLLEWFAPDFRTSCIVMGPTAGGTGPHHVDGTGGLSQPGTMTLADNGDVLLPNAGTDEIVRIDHASLPSSATACTGGVYPPTSLRTSVFFHGTGSLLPFPAGIARDPACDCYAVSSYFGNPAIAWLDSSGTPMADRPGIPGATAAQLADNPYGYNPFGLAFAPDGTLYFVDIHLTCPGGNLTDCGPADYGGRIMRVTFHGSTPSSPVAVLGGFDFPISVTVCVPTHQRCPYPSGRAVPPSSGPSENNAPAHGPPAGSRATAGFG